MSVLAVFRSGAAARPPAPPARDSERAAVAESLDYWLWYVEGYSVESAGRRLGTVVRVILGRDFDRPVALVVCDGGPERVVSASSVLCLDLAGALIVLEPDAADDPADACPVS